jgi:hypothetical protein
MLDFYRRAGMRHKFDMPARRFRPADRTTIKAILHLVSHPGNRSLQALESDNADTQDT